MSEIVKTVEFQLQRYPLSRLKDIYKSFFQDEFGPGHILEAPEEAINYLKKELSTAKSQSRYEAELCGTGKHFCRISLDLIIDGRISLDRYFSEFISGAADFALPEIGEWKIKWNNILEKLKPLSHVINNFDEDSVFILRNLEEGKYAMHHSSLYRQAYDPHYRIFRISNSNFDIS